ncbi:hypothetical protein PGT21_028024 [Puccinia graminis f. sp. tritici]|uniref:Uncharacterized protein n=1 Tax=Puccinia graminis f. sp. tritici TaxID=56615 RepID=A0A5B0MLW8_PUCGR|nr:hypothetical protein PGT21_028024 [Puccinia graminis f. sp. tritici]
MNWILLDHEFLFFLLFDDLRHSLLISFASRCKELLTANGWIPSRAPATWLRSIQRTLGRAWHHLDASENVQGMLGRQDHPEDGVQPGVHRTLDWECPMDNKKTINRTLLRVSD